MMMLLKLEKAIKYIKNRLEKSSLLLYNTDSDLYESEMSSEN